MSYNNGYWILIVAIAVSCGVGRGCPLLCVSALLLVLVLLLLLSLLLLSLVLLVMVDDWRCCWWWLSRWWYAKTYLLCLRRTFGPSPPTSRWATKATLAWCVPWQLRLGGARWTLDARLGVIRMMNISLKGIWQSRVCFTTPLLLADCIWSDVVEGFRTSFISFHQIMSRQQKVRPAGDIWQQHPQMRRYAFGRWVGKLYWKVPILCWWRETLYKGYWCSAGIIKMTKLWYDYYVII